MTVPNVLAQNEILNREAHVGFINELPVDEQLMFPTWCPFHEVPSDDVIFSYGQPEVIGKAPARAEDAESVTVRNDDTAGYGRASVIDWALKHSYSSSDVTRHREYLSIVEGLADGTSVPLFMQEGSELQKKVDRDAKRRKRSLDNRFEANFITGLEFGALSYDDGDVIYGIDFGRPTAQTTGNAPSGVQWSVTDGSHDPVDDFVTIKTFMRDTYGTSTGIAIMSEQSLYLMARSAKFAQLSGLPMGRTDSISGKTIDPRYAIPGFSVDMIKAHVKASTGIDIVTYDAGIRTRPLGQNNLSFERFMTEGKVICLPSMAEMDAVTDTEFGFMGTLTSPHPENNFQHGYYAWEVDEVDPWRKIVGTGRKAFPVFPMLELTYVFTAHAPTSSVGAYTQPGSPLPLP